MKNDTKTVSISKSWIVEKPSLSLKTQAIVSILAIVGAVVVPQFFHLLGKSAGIGNSLGEIFLPMHLPVILAGLLAGPYVGAISGLLGPLVSFLLSGMPGAAMLPFMMIELCGYGLTAGLLRNVKMPSFAKVVIVQIAGRALKAVAILIAFYLFDNTKIGVAAVWASIPKGLFGLVLQWTLLPLIVYRVENSKKSE